MKNHEKMLFDLDKTPEIHEAELELAGLAQAVVERNYDIDAQMRRWLTEAIKASPRSRYEIAGKVSELLNREISKYQLDSWTAESKEGYHLPAAYVPALCAVLDDTRGLRILAEVLGIQLAENQDLLWLQYAKANELERKARMRKKQLAMKLKNGGPQ